MRISHGDAESAVLASAAIPGVFPSIACAGRRLVDGGVAENTPIADAVELRADTIYVLPTGAPCHLASAARGAIPMLVHALALLINQRLAADIDRYAQEARLIVFPPPCPQTVQAWDFSQAQTLIEQGYASASQVLDDAGREDYWRGRAGRAPARALLSAGFAPAGRVGASGHELHDQEPS